MTNKLTADKARERIAQLTAWRDQRGLTLREEDYLEALETHLRVLYLQPVKPDHPEAAPYGDPYSVWANGANWMLEQLK